MPHQVNFGPKSSYKRASSAATVRHSQTNFGGRTKKQGGTNKSRVQMQTTKASIRVKSPKSHFGEKAGTGSRGGY